MILQKLPTSLARLVKLLKEEMTLNGALSPLKAKEVVLKADVQLVDMLPYADFDHPVEDCYGRKLVYEDGHFEVMVMSWNPGDYSSIHNHGHTQWGVVQVFGHTHHLVYQVKNGVMDFAKKEILPAGGAVKVNNAFLHQMGNATTSGYMTLHVYGSNLVQENITADAKNFDLELDRIAYTCGGAFFNLSDDAVHKVEPGVQPTQTVFMHYAHLLMDYYNRQKPTPKIAQLKRRLMEKMKTRIFEMPEAELAV